jgi:hypothetical protein
MRWKLLFVAGMLFSILLVGMDIGSATTAGPNSPGTIVDGGEYANIWLDPDNGKVSDDTYANNTFNLETATLVRGRDYAVKLIKGGVLQSANKAKTSANWETTDTYVSYGGSTDLWSTSWTPDDINNNSFGISFQPKFRDSADPDISVTLNSLKATNFGFAIPSGSTINGILVQVERKITLGVNPIATASVDHIRITVYYTEGEPPPSTCWHVEDGLCWLPPNCNVTFSDFLGACFT